MNVGTRKNRASRGSDIAKRCLDLLLSVIALLLLSPLVIIVALAVLAFLGPPVFFRQVRPGLHGRPFTMIKFRTMEEATDEDGRPLSDEQRLGRFGTFLRASSLDELPELLNVIRGDMSLVGPRPLLMEYLPLYTPEQYRRHTVRPGITGWAQINGRNAISWEEKFELDLWYVDHRSIWLDLRILCLTVMRVFRAENVSHPEHATTERFRGSAR